MALNPSQAKIHWVFEDQPSISLKSLPLAKIKYWHIDEKIKISNRCEVLVLEGHCNTEKIEKILKRFSSGQMKKVMFGSHDCHRAVSLHNQYKFDCWFNEQNEIEAFLKKQEQKLSQSSNNRMIHLQELKKVNAFIKKIESSDSVESLFSKVQNEFTKYFGVKNVFLALEEEGESAEIWHFQRNKIVKKQPHRIWESSTRMSLNNSDSQDYFVELLKRPVGQIIAMPLLQALDKSRLETKGVPYIFLEHSIPKEQIEVFLEWMSSRIHPVSYILDNLFKKNFFKKISFNWEQIFDNLDHPMAIIDSDHNVLRGNDRFKISSGTDTMKCYQMFVGREMPCVNCPLERGGRQLIDRRYKDKKESFVVDSYLLPVEAKGGAKVFVNHYLDETKSYHLKKQVIQQEKMAALGHLAGHIAHELNNPLTGIHSLSQFLADTWEGEDTVLGDLQEVKKASQRCHQIVKNLLGFGRGEEKKKVVNLNEVTESALQLVKTAMSHHQKEFVFSQEPLMLEAEPHLLQQVIFNLINNACQAMLEPGLLNIETKSDDGFCYLKIRDSGPGIPENLREKIFDPFFTTKERGKGTGLGLSMSMEIIKKFNGRLKLNNSASGAEFEIVLPKIVDKGVSL